MLQCGHVKSEWLTEEWFPLSLHYRGGSGSLSASEQGRHLYHMVSCGGGTWVINHPKVGVRCQQAVCAPSQGR